MSEEGYCKLCSICCQWLCIGSEGVEDESFKQWIRYRGGRITNGIAFLPSKCHMLQSDNKCSVHDKKPEFCREFPKHRPDYLDGLGCKYFE